MSALDDASASLVDLAAAVSPGPGSVHLDGSTLWIDNPRSRNALTVGMMGQLAGVVAALQSTSLGVVVVRGTAGTFCSGGHLGQVREGLVAPERGRQMCAAMTVVLDHLAAAPCLVVAAVEGAARGGGAELLTAADHRVVDPDATIGFVQARLGITPGWGATARLARILGPTAALRWLSTGGVRRGEAIGPLADVVGPLEPTLTDFLAPLAAVDPAALQAVKRAVLSETPLERTGGEAEIFGQVWGGAAHRDALGR